MKKSLVRISLLKKLSQFDYMQWPNLSSIASNVNWINIYNDDEEKNVIPARAIPRSANKTIVLAVILDQVSHYFAHLKMRGRYIEIKTFYSQKRKEIIYYLCFLEVEVHASHIILSFVGQTLIKLTPKQTSRLGYPA